MKTKIGGTILRDGKTQEFNIIGIKTRSGGGVVLEFMLGDHEHPNGLMVEEINIPDKMAKTMVKIMIDKNNPED